MNVILEEALDEVNHRVDQINETIVGADYEIHNI